MAGILVYAETRGNVVLPITFELLAAARTLSNAGLGEVICCLAAADTAALTSQLKGADRILAVQHPSLSSYHPEAHGIVLHAAAAHSKPQVVLVAYSSSGTDLGAALAVQCDYAMIGYCTTIASVGGGIETTSQLYGGKLAAKAKSSLPAVVAMVPGSYDEEIGKNGGAAKIDTLKAPDSLGSLKMRLVSLSKPEAGQIDLTKADRIVCVGRGIGSAEKIPVAEAFAKLINAEIAGSRPVIDSGWMPKARQVGKSGQKVKPKLYIATGVSGAPEHLEGMKSADCIIAINSDAKAPIFGVAHYGTTCDLFELLPAISKLLA